MAAPILYAGSRTARLLQLGVGYTDDGIAYTLLGQSERIAPAGSGGECIFTLCYLTTRHFDTSVSVQVTPIIDNVAQATQTIALTGAASANGVGNRQTHELALSVPYSPSGTEQLRVAPRGTWFELVLATPNTTQAKVLIETAELEYEVVRESMAGEAR